ncbi:MAG: hypothetical protein A2898_02415 [Candidatus Kerfeldbacteria bacterium RIFCSPLOWO2_01_FULL_48_11]|uniref:DUF456 domain-containing protein n=1 Tax=Candidatus Kerfeldbacteria bacterium RIFCSPLOWO2_01_FULL_48_11 TaxID=1798543 RepID=A0A1G2B382_9BACT|nr:MAG: hypothetical protein UY34_C0021G0003 [Parcubacteria group bacterium GW2011_GWA2_48_9]OGY83109.1 MAG: hypothetical protein A2898_02415 [Candidatus Kerfeldbacteria bacterium RIFCSPLOWO2_01_FULL_48_11]
MPFLTIIIFIITLILMLVGLLGVVLPILPGIPIIFTVALGFGFLTDFAYVGWNLIAIFGILAVISLILDWLGAAYGVKKMGGTVRGMVGSVIGMMIGITGGLGGIIIGSFIGAFAFELIGGKTREQALRASTGSIIGFVGGGIIKLAIGAAMIGVFVYQVLM